MRPIATSVDTPIRSPREEIIATFGGDAFSPNRSLTKMWNTLLEVVLKNPEVAREEFEYRGVLMPLLHWAYFKKSPVTVFRAVHDAHPEASRHPVMRRASNLQVTLLQDAMYRLNSNCRYTRWELNVLGILIESYPEALTVPTWRTYYDSPYVIILFHPQEKIRKHLLPVVQAHLSRQLGQRCTERGGEMPWKDRFPIDVIEHLVSLHRCKSLALIVHQSTTRLRSQIRFSLCNINHSRSPTLRIVLLGNEPNFELQDLSSLSVPLVSVTTNSIDDRVYQAGTINPFIITKSISDLQELKITCLVDSTRQLRAFVSGLKNLPNVEGLSLNLVCAFCCCQRDYSINSTIASLGEIQVSHLQLWFMDAFPQDAVAEMLRRSTTLHCLKIDGSFMAESADEIADALKTNTSLKILQLGFYLQRVAVFLPVLSLHNFTLEQFAAVKALQRDTTQELQVLNHYCDLNKAGRKSLRGISADRHSAVLALEQAEGDVPTLYGLLRFRPDLWSEA